MKSVAISSSVATADVLDFGRCCCCCSPMSLSEGANFLAPDGERTREKRRVPHFPPAQKKYGTRPAWLRERWNLEQRTHVSAFGGGGLAVWRRIFFCCCCLRWHDSQFSRMSALKTVTTSSAGGDLKVFQSGSSSLRIDFGKFWHCNKITNFQALFAIFRSQK